MVRDNLYFDITLKNLNAPVVRDYLRAVMDLVGADYMLWCSDCPGTFMKKSYQQILAEICDTERFSKDELALLLGGTARRVYHCQATPYTAIKMHLVHRQGAFLIIRG